jgi:putative transposase
MNTKTAFQFDQFYHIYNRTHNKDDLFKEERNFSFFLYKYKMYLGPFLDIHAYALIRNHFHFSVRVKSQHAINRILKGFEQKGKTVAITNYLESSSKEESIHQLLINQHNRFFVSYTKAFNKVYNRTGGLFQRSFKHSLFDPDIKFKYLQYYIHHNGRKHGLVDDFRDYTYTSYDAICYLDNSFLASDFVIQQFGGIAKFRQFHEEDAQIYLG